MNCGNCDFYRTRETLDENMGECLFNPPTIIVTKDGPGSFYPIVATDARCGFYAGPTEVEVPLNAQSARGQSVHPNLR